MQPNMLVLIMNGSPYAIEGSTSQNEKLKRELAEVGREVTQGAAGGRATWARAGIAADVSGYGSGWPRDGRSLATPERSS